MRRLGKKGNVGAIPQMVIAFILIGMMVAVGVIILDKFSYAVKDSTTNTNQFTSNGTNTLSGTPVVSLGAVVNSTGDDLSGRVTLVDANTGSISIVQDNSTTDYWNVTYVYKASTSSSDVLDDSVTAVEPITSDWLPILVIIAIVGLILALILGAFTLYKRR